jgi:RES domain-containing protein
MLEYFVHLDKEDRPNDLVLALAEVPDELACDRVEVAALPASWRDPVAPPELTRIGDEFARRGNHCLLYVPSALAPRENNCVINPGHRAFSQVKIRELEPLEYDPRMFGEPGHGRPK